MSGLTPQQELFAQSIGDSEFDFNWLAYEKHYDCSKMSKNAIYVETCKLLQNPKIALRIKEIQDQHRKRNEVTLDEVLKEMANWLRFDVKSIFKEDGSMKALHEMTDQESSSISQYEVVELFGNNGDGKVQIGYLKKVKLLDKRAVADMFLKKFGAYIENHKVTVDNFDYLDDLLHQIKK